MQSRSPRPEICDRMMLMRTVKSMAAGGLILLGLVLPGRAQKVEFHLSYGGWSFSPFTSLVERETENLVKEELTRLVDSVLPSDVFSTFENIDISSSGRMAALTMWVNWGRFSLGLESDYFEFNLPFTISAEQSVEFLNTQLLNVRTRGSGEVRLHSVMFSFLTRWAVVSTSRFHLHLRGGINLMPFDGEISLDQRTVITTPLGDSEFSGVLSETVKNIRGWDEDIPSLLFAPSFGVNLQYDLLPRLGVFAGLAVHQGLYAAVGLAVTL